MMTPEEQAVELAKEAVKQAFEPAPEIVRTVVGAGAEITERRFPSKAARRQAKMLLVLFVLALMPTGCDEIDLAVKENLPKPTVAEAKQNLANAEKACANWQTELADHPELQKSDVIEATQRKTKHLCEAEVRDAEIDVVVAEKNAQATQTTEPTQSDEARAKAEAEDKKSAPLTPDGHGGYCKPSDRIETPDGWVCPKETR
jgi:hypothetical protein